MNLDPRAQSRPPEHAQQRRRHGAGRHDAGRHDAGRHDAGPRPNAQRRHGAGRLLWLPVILATIGLAVVACLGPRKLATGQAASGFSLPELARSGHQIALSDFAGRPVIINFFASWSPPCQAETRLLAHFYRFYHGTVQVIGVDSRDDRGAGLSLIRRALVAYPVATDPSLVVAARYRVPGIPATYFLNARHQVVRADLGWLSWKKLTVGLRAMRGD